MVSNKEQEKLEQRIEKLQNDTSLDWARGPVALRALAVSTSLAALSTPVAFLYGAIPGVVAVAVMFTGYLLLRGATRGIAELPDRYLDERELALRNATYVKAFQWLAGLIGFLAVLVFFFAIFQDANDVAVTVSLNFDQVQALVWLFLGPVAVIPTVSLALRGKK